MFLFVKIYSLGIEVTMMMMIIIIIIIIFIIIIYITFKGYFLSRQYFEMLVLFSYISITQSMGIDLCN